MRLEDLDQALVLARIVIKLFQLVACRAEGAGWRELAGWTGGPVSHACYAKAKYREVFSRLNARQHLPWMGIALGCTSLD